MQLFVRTETETLGIDVGGDATVADVRAALRRQHPTAAAGQLLWQDQPAADHQTLADLGAGAEAVFTLMAQAAEWQPREDCQRIVHDCRIHVRTGAGVPEGRPLAERVSKDSGGRVTLLGPQRPEGAPEWEWRVQVCAPKEWGASHQFGAQKRDSTRDVNLYVGIARPGIDLDRADRDGLYGSSAATMRSELWLVVNDACWTNASRPAQQGWGNAKDGDVVVMRHRVDGTLTFSIAGRTPRSFTDVRGELCPLVQFDRVGAGAALLYAGPPSE